MSLLKTSLITALLSVGVTAGGFYYFHQGRMREAGRLQGQNNRMRAEASRRHQARVAVPPPAVSVGSASAGTMPAFPVAVATPVQKPVEYYRNEGNASPLATLQTFAWACDRGDTDTVGRLLYIEAAARPKVEAIMAGMPESVRTHWKNADEMAAALLTERIMRSPFPDAEILATATVEPITTDRVRLRLPDIPKDGTEYERTAEGWKYVITEKMVDGYIAYMKEQAKATR